MTNDDISDFRISVVEELPPALTGSVLGFVRICWEIQPWALHCTVSHLAGWWYSQ